ncbi:NADH kinase-like [Rhodamnia argentea]|uniref:NADH kinase-like n=1 Tax=Rhodamnia argentea TaxID=178133 RepID=A0A8B8NSJ9_9MYRT|nr:NADH kinase-like [Rhodamnia argentea]
MARRKLLVLLKPFDVFPVRTSDASRTINSQTSQILEYLDNRRKVHKDAIRLCQSILQRKPVDWEPVLRNDLSQPIQNVDLVVTIGGDGTLLQASHFMDDSIPVLGVNSDPTQAKEVEDLNDAFDATRSTGYLCAANVNNFEQMLDDILDDRLIPSKLTRLAVHVNSHLMPKYALNDILVSHPCPAAVSRFSFRIRKHDQPCSPLVNCRSSGLRVSTAAGSTAAMLSTGGYQMPILSQDLQYIVREPISPGAAFSLMRGVVQSDQLMDAAWFCKDGVIHIDGSHVRCSIKHGDNIVISSKAPVLSVYLPSYVLS